MALFDYIYLECPVTIPDYVDQKFKNYIQATINQDDFQTKDFENMLDQYVINSNFELIRTRTGWFLEEENSIEEKIYFHGEIEIHTIIYVDDSNLIDTGEYFNTEPSGYKSRIIGPNIKKNWFTLAFKIKFTDGLVENISMIEPTEKELLELIRLL